MTNDSLTPEQVAVLDELPHREPYLSFRRIVISQARRVVELESALLSLKLAVVGHENTRHVHEPRAATETTGLQSHAKWLRRAAEEISKEGHAGWGNTCAFAADAIERASVPPTDELAEAKLDIKTLLAICRDQENEVDTVDNDFPAGARRAIARRWFPVETGDRHD